MLQLLRKGCHHVRKASYSQSLQNAALCILFEGIQVVSHRAGEKHRILGHKAHRLPQSGQAQVPGVHLVDEDTPGPRLQDPQQDQQEAALAAARGPDDPHLGAGFKAKIDLLQHISRISVAGSDILHLDVRAIQEPAALHAHQQLLAAGEAHRGDPVPAQLLRHGLGAPRVVHGHHPVPALGLRELGASRAKVLELRNASALGAGHQEAAVGAGQQQHLALSGHLYAFFGLRPLHHAQLLGSEPRGEAPVPGVPVGPHVLLLGDLQVFMNAGQGDELELRPRGRFQVRLDEALQQ
mmetsp:Transcript_111178/g.265303  ORF Transcript_111178/g.265303 Transcript_111178/m.265303 type:complete len:295 (+) Transcript_111178:461-1345(+)